MKRRRENKNNIIIDLTSLLDVVFIVLLVLICQLQTSGKKTEQAEKDAKRAELSANAAAEIYNDLSDSHKNLSDYVVFIAVNSQFEENLTTRHINLLCSDETVTIPEIKDLEGTYTDGYKDLRNFIEDYIKANSTKTIVLSLNENDEDILYRDEKAIKQIFTELTIEYDNVKKKD